MSWRGVSPLNDGLSFNRTQTNPRHANEAMRHSRNKVLIFSPADRLCDREYGSSC
jgi:hypothetical protein